MNLECNNGYSISDATVRTSSEKRCSFDFVEVVDVLDFFVPGAAVDDNSDFVLETGAGMDEFDFVVMLVADDAMNRCDCGF